MASNYGGWYRETRLRSHRLGGYPIQEREWVQKVCRIMNLWALMATKKSPENLYISIDTIPSSMYVGFSPNLM